jgi:uncharacterized protein DUF4262
MPTAGPQCRCIICHDYGDRDRLGKAALRTIVHVTQYGWSVVLVQPTGSRPGWVYTVGLWHSHNSPELTMFGGDVYEMEVCLNTLGGQIAAGRPLVEGEQRDGILRGVPVALRGVDGHWYEALFGQALGFYRRPPLPFCQVVWPSGDGLFPWQQGADAAYLRAQPPLWEAPGRTELEHWTQPAGG